MVRWPYAGLAGDFLLALGIGNGVRMVMVADPDALPVAASVLTFAVVLWISSLVQHRG